MQPYTLVSVFLKLFVIGLAGLAGCGGPTDPGQDEPRIEVDFGVSGSLTLLNVHLVDPERRTVVRNQGVAVRDGTISSLLVTDPEGDGTVVTGVGDVYLLPGLHDVHVHLFDRSEFWLYLANGVTSVRNLSGTPTHLAWRDSIEVGQIVGPRLRTSGPILDGDPPTRSTNTVVITAAEAEAEVERQRAAGYDFIKIYDNVPVEVYEQILATAGAASLPVVGHLPTPVALSGVTEAAGQSEIQHSEELFPYTVSTESTPEMVGEALANAGIALVPTVGVMESAYLHARDGAAALEQAPVAYVSQRIRDLFGWEPTVLGRAGQPGAEGGFLARLNRAQEIAVATHRAGGRVLVGSDAPIPTLVPGFAIHDELRLLVEAGIGEWDTLAGATHLAADALGVPGGGRLRSGAPADFVLLGGDPSEDIANTRRILAVVRDGRLITADELAQGLAAIAAENEGAP